MGNEKSITSKDQGTRTATFDVVKTFALATGLKSKEDMSPVDKMVSVRSWLKDSKYAEHITIGSRNAPYGSAKIAEGGTSGTLKGVNHDKEEIMAQAEKISRFLHEKRIGARTGKAAIGPVPGLTMSKVIEKEEHDVKGDGRTGYSAAQASNVKMADWREEPVTNSSAWLPASLASQVKGEISSNEAYGAFKDLVPYYAEILNSKTSDDEVRL